MLQHEQATGIPPLSGCWVKELKVQLPGLWFLGFPGLCGSAPSPSCLQRSLGGIGARGLSLHPEKYAN